MYNSRQPPKKIAVLPATIVTVEDTTADSDSGRSGVHHRMYFVEPFLPGEYVKHTSNYGFVGHQVETQPGSRAMASQVTARQTPQCFSYFSWHASGGKEVVSDIQGVQDIYTDPQIHSLPSGGEERQDDMVGNDTGMAIASGAGNLGYAGIVAFLSTHGL